MRYSVMIAMSALLTIAAVPALASACEDQIRALEARVDDASSRAAALSGGGQGVAASRESQAMQADAQKSPSGTAQRLPEHDVKATSAVTPLAGGDKPMKAKAALERARALDREGNAAGCAEALADATRELGPGQ